jgi:hypothetical protein
LNKSPVDTDIFSDIAKGVNPTVAGHATAYRTAFSRYMGPINDLESVSINKTAARLVAGRSTA